MHLLALLALLEGGIRVSHQLFDILVRINQLAYWPMRPRGMPKHRRRPSRYFVTVAQEIMFWNDTVDVLDPF
jgi:hypothetical protein